MSLSTTMFISVINKMKELMIYLKTTDTCQLDCKHCFTSGSNGKKGWFDEVATVEFMKRMKVRFPHFNNINISFHGGEPLLCPLDKMEYFYEEVRKLWINVTWGIQTNLTFKLGDDKIDFLKKVTDANLGTSYDKGIRWTTDIQKNLWAKNVKILTDQNFDVTCMVCIDKTTIETDPREILDYLISLGVKYVNFERITADGNAVIFSDIIPDNLEMDAWILKLWEVTKEPKYHENIYNMLFGSILSGVTQGAFNGCRSRECEQKILTINADGTIGGCPNNAPNNTFGTIHDEIDTLLSAPGRSCLISEELLRNDICYGCDVYDVCNGDCHQLTWQGDVCASPKSMMRDAKVTEVNLIKAMQGSLAKIEGVGYNN